MVKGGPSNPVRRVTNTSYSRLGSKRRLSQNEDLVLIPSRWCFIRKMGTLPVWRVQEFDSVEPLVAPSFSLTSSHQGTSPIKRVNRYWTDGTIILGIIKLVNTAASYIYNLSYT